MEEIIPNQLRLFNELPQLLTVGDSFYEKINCKTALSENVSSLDFTANPDMENYTDLYRSLFVIKTRYLKKDRSAIEAAPSIGPTNGLLHSLFKQIDLYINNRKVSPVESNLHYISYISNFFQPPSVQKSSLSLSVWEPDVFETQAELEQTDPQAKSHKNTGLKTRADLFANSRIVTLIGRVFTPAHLIQQFYMPGLKFDWTAVLNGKALHSLQKPDLDEDTYTFDILSAEIWLRRVRVNPSVHAAHLSLLANKPIKMYCKYFLTRQQHLMQGAYNFKFQNFFQVRT